jgi:putative SOS response-associated peptidase YedK
MCSRYELTSNAREIMVRFRLSVPPLMPNRAEIRPTDAALVVTSDGAARLLGWGLPVDWDARPLINARAETLASRPTFRPLLSRRVLIPATSWWEWRKDGKARHKTRLQPAAGGLFAFAGLADGERFTMITCAAAADVAAVHDRMPVVVDEAAEAAWLDSSRPFAEVAPLLVPTGRQLRVSEEAAAGVPGLFND